MDYTIISKTGYKAKAHTEEEACEKAFSHFQQWLAVGRIVKTSVYYRSTLVAEYDETSVTAIDRFNQADTGLHEIPIER